MVSDKTILVVDDEPRVVEFITMNLELEGFRVISASSGYEALEKVTRELPTLVILDIMMPDMDGFETLRRIRQVSSVPVIFLSVKGEEVDRVRGLDLGADDYMTKPFSPRELVSRIKAVLRRTESSALAAGSEIVVDDDLRINFNERKVIVRGREVPLRPTEYRLLYQLVSNAGRLLSHETLLSRVWGPEYRDEDHYVRLYITYLRQKIEEDPKNPKYILSERGLGYRFKEFGKPKQ
ncbi:MAG TPA: response regulator transcription factor [Dehalococcoidia bacterium]|jgi:two-component system KDP operon response regulator KdpE|nr:response regulator transcription factor [Dehalococcoidia bacterium]